MEPWQLAQGFTDPDGDPLTIQGMTVEHGGVFLFGDGTFLLYYDKDYAGPVTFRYQISDGAGGVVRTSLTGTVINPAGDTDCYLTEYNPYIIEKPGEGIDTIYASTNVLGLPDNVENLTLMPLSGATGGIGNDLDNVIRGNGLANTLGTGLGRDTVYAGAGAGADTIYMFKLDFSSGTVPNDGNDIVYGGLGDDTIRAAAPLNNKFYGGQGDDAVYYVTGMPNSAFSEGDIKVTTNGRVTTVTGPGGTDTLYDVERIAYLMNTPNGLMQQFITIPTPAHRDPYLAAPQQPPAFQSARGGPVLVLTQAALTDGYVDPNRSAMYAIDLSDQFGNSYAMDEDGNYSIPGYEFKDGNNNPVNTVLHLTYRIVDDVGSVTVTRDVVFRSGHEGDDSWVVNAVSDAVVELPDEGNDAVTASIDYRLSASGEDLLLVGTALVGDGNKLANTLAGNDPANRLSGRAGSDILAGGRDAISGGNRRRHDHGWRGQRQLRLQHRA